MATVFTVVRQLASKNGTAIYVPLVTYDTEERAIKASRELKQIVDQMAGGTIAVGGKPVTNVGTLLAELGIHTITFTYFKSEVTDTDIVRPRPSLIIPS